MSKECITCENLREEAMELEGKIEALENLLNRSADDAFDLYKKLSNQ